jgi:hypothetical protein
MPDALGTRFMAVSIAMSVVQRTERENGGGGSGDHYEFPMLDSITSSSQARISDQARA